MTTQPNYVQRRDTLKRKFQDVKEKFQAILDALKATPEVFSKAVVNPNRGLTQDEKSELQSFITKLCAIEVVKKEVVECTPEKPQKSSKSSVPQTDLVTQLTSDVSLLEKLREFVEGGLIDPETILGTGRTHTSQQDHLLNLFESAIQTVKFDKRNPEIGKMNLLVRAYREAVSSLQLEFQEQTKSAPQATFGTESKTVRASFDDQFKTEGTDPLAETWNADKASKASDASAVVLYVPQTPKVHAPVLHPDARPDSKEALDDINTMGSYHLMTMLGGMQVLYVKTVVLPALMSAACTNYVNTGYALDDSATKSIALQKAKFALVNFKTIFSGMTTDYTANLETAFANIEDIRIIDVNTFNYANLMKGIGQIFEIIHFVNTEHNWGEGKMPDVFAMCPGLKQIAIVHEQPEANTAPKPVHVVEVVQQPSEQLEEGVASNSWTRTTACAGSAHQDNGQCD